MGYTTVQASKTDRQVLADIRVNAMRESLQAVGRFDPIRARERFLNSFNPENTKLIVVLDQIIGFYVTIEKNDCLYLEHLYISPNSQGSNIGSKVLSEIKMKAVELNLPIRLNALRDSRSNTFYQKNGFTKTHEEEWDIHYKWSKMSPT